jgi:prephenate dehydrogenase
VHGGLHSRIRFEAKQGVDLLLIASRGRGGFNRPVLFPKIALVGVGLLGGSLALAIRARKLARTVQGYVRRESSVAECERAGLKDFATLDLLAAVSDADLVILCTPLSQMRALTEAMLPGLKRGAIVSDVGSVKGSVVTEVESIVSRAGGFFIGGHPMAGGEKSGVIAARADLFESAACVLTPTANSNPDALQKLEEFWRALGARVLKLTPLLHDELVARCSHLPHVLAAALANYVLDGTLPKEQPLLCANGFRDTTRIASGSPEMWRDIALANSGQLVSILEVFMRDLQQFKGAISSGDARAVEKFFSTAKQRRDGWCGQTASPSSE